MNSIEWLIEQMIIQGYFDGNKPLSYTNLDHLQQQAKEMHNQELHDEYIKGYNYLAEYIKKIINEQIKN